MPTSPLGMDAVIHGFFVEGVLRGAAELKPIGQPLSNEAELAFSIEKAWQSHGVGSALLERTLLAARNRGLKFLHMACLADNKRMLELARKFDADLSFDFSSVVGEVRAPRPTPLSVMREIPRGQPRVRDRHAGRAVAPAQAGVTRQAASG